MHLLSYLAYHGLPSVRLSVIREVFNDREVFITSTIYIRTFHLRQTVIAH